MEKFEKQELTEHLAELRRCLIVCLIAVAVGFVAAYGVVDKIASWFFKPLVNALPANATLIFTSYQEGFFFI